MKKEYINNNQYEKLPGQTMDAPIVTVKNLVIYRGRTDIDKFTVKIPTLCIPGGKIVAIVGPSGCGKSSLLTVLGLMRGSKQDQDCRITCEELSFHFKGQDYLVYKELYDNDTGFIIDYAQLERLRQEAIGFCLQGGELTASLPLQENVAVTGFLSKRDDPLSSAANCLKRLRLDDQLKSIPNQLSGGQRQRGIIARALAHSPALIILDEPTSSLDRSTAEEALHLLKECTDYGQTVLMVTHDRILADEFADIIIEMDIINKRQGGIINTINTRQPKYTSLQQPLDNNLKAITRPKSLKLATWQEPWRYYLRLGFMDALGPLYQIFSMRGNSTFSGSERLKLLYKLHRHLNPRKIKENFAFAAQLAKNAVVLVAIGLLILILMGMRSGLIEQFRYNLTKSPTGRQLILTPKMRRHGLTLAQLDELQQKYPELDLIIPVSKYLVSLDKELTEDNTLTIYGTVPEDPMLRMVYSDQDFSTMNSDTIILSKILAQKHKLAVGDSINAWVRRFIDAEGKQIEALPARLTISHTIDIDDPKVAYVYLDFARQIANYKNGRPVQERGWPGFARAVTPRYSAFLLATKGILSSREERVLAMRGLVAKPIEEADHTSILYGWLKDPETIQQENLPNLYLWCIQSGRQDGDYCWLNPSIGEVESHLIDSDGIMFPWNEPIEGALNGQSVLMVGLTGRLRWLRKYLSPGHAFYSPHHEGWLATFDNLKAAARQQKLLVTIEEQPLELAMSVHTIEEDKPEVKPGNDLIDSEAILPTPPHILAVPAAFLARLYMFGEGLAEPDHHQRIFRTANEEEEYYQIRAYVNDVYQVVRLHEKLSEEFGVQSNASRVAEMKKYTITLDVIVRVISIFALVIAFFTAVLVFKEVGESKKRMVATLRIMGLTKCGVYVLMIVRSVLVAGVAAVLLLILGSSGAVILNSIYNTEVCLLAIQDYLIVGVGVIATCVIGVLFPSRLLTKTDPVVAFEEANKFA